MMRYRLPIKKLLKTLGQNNHGVALILVLATMATLAIFVSEITYTAQTNQKLAYDRLDQIKAHALAKSGLRLAILRIRAYTELKKTVKSLTGKSAAAQAAASSLVPKAVLEKVWSEPITIPFSGDLSSLPMGVRDAMKKFREESGMQGKLYLAIESQSAQFNLNTLVPSAIPTPAPATPTPSSPNGINPDANENPTPSPSPTPNPAGAEGQEYTRENAREQLLNQLKTTLANRFETDNRFRDQYRNFLVEDLVDEIIGWADLGYDTLRSDRAEIPFKRAPFYDVSELHFLTSMDDELYDLFAPQFIAGVSSGINVNVIKETVLKALVPEMTEEERKLFFEFRDVPPPDDNTFKTADDFFKYLGEKVQAFTGAPSAMENFKKNLARRGIQISVDEEHFKIRVEATVNQTKRTLEAWVSIFPQPAQPPANANNPNAPTANSSTPRSNIKITQMRFL